MQQQQSTPAEQERATIERNIELSREGFRRFEAGDIDGVLELYAPDAEVQHLEGWPEPGPSRGHGTIARQFRALGEDWTEQRVVVEHIEGRGEWVVARVRWQGRGGESGAEVQLSYSAATRVKDGLIAEVRFHWEHDDALQAAGWKPESA